MSFELPYTWKDYYVFVKEPELVEKALENGWNHFVLFEKDDFSWEEIDEIIRTHRNIIKFHFDPNNEFRFETLERKKDLDLYITSFNPNGLYKYYDDQTSIKSFSDVLDHLPRIINHMEIRMLRKGLTWCNDYEDRCGNCRSLLSKGEKYCSNCGTERGKGEFIPYKTGISSVLYGDPIIKRKYKCLSCGNIWDTTDSISNHCPQCGSGNISKFEEKEDDWIH